MSWLVQSVAAAGSSALHALGRRPISSLSLEPANIYASVPNAKEVLFRLFQLELAKPGGLDERGAEHVKILSGAHEGGFFKESPLHLSFIVYDAKGHAITTTNPLTGKVTERHHLDLPSYKSAEHFKQTLLTHAAKGTYPTP